MADVIRVEAGDLQQCASKYLSALETLKAAHSAYQKSIDALRGDWTGTAFEIMSGKVASMGANIVKSFDRLTDAVSELNAVKEVFDDDDKKKKSVISNLDTGKESPFNIP